MWAHIVAQAQSDRLGIGQGQGQLQIVCMEIRKLIIPTITWLKALDGPFHACINIIVSRILYGTSCIKKNVLVTAWKYPKPNIYTILRMKIPRYLA